ncbi:MAG: HAD family phosphatase [Bacteroidales bacterium]|nr:HAD family phosphatase [Bacteroidales bacterium]
MMLKEPYANIKNIIFDWGGVILNIDYSLTSLAFKKLGIQNIDDHFSQLKQTPLFDDFETGRLSAGDFRNSIKKHLDEDTTDYQIDMAWSAMLLDTPAQRVKLLEKVKQQYRIFLLSNTNEIHELFYIPILDRQLGNGYFFRLFEKVYLSHKIGMHKPQASAFNLVIGENQLKPSETLFIDDSPQHIEAARKNWAGCPPPGKTAGYTRFV